MIKWLMSLLDAVNRRTDLRILWPICKEHASNLDHAKAAFMFHVSNDNSWTDHYTKSELINFVDTLS